MAHDFLTSEFKSPQRSRDLDFQTRNHRVGDDRLFRRSNPARQSINSKEAGMKNFQACLQCQQGLNSSHAQSNAQRPQERGPDTSDASNAEQSSFWPSIFEYTNQYSDPPNGKITLELAEDSLDSDFIKRAQIPAEAEAKEMEAEFLIDPLANGLSEPLPELDSWQTKIPTHLESQPRYQESQPPDQEIQAPDQESQAPDQSQFGTPGLMPDSTEGQLVLNGDVVVREGKWGHSQDNESDEVQLADRSRNNLSVKESEQASESGESFSQNDSADSQDRQAPSSGTAADTLPPIRWFANQDTPFSTAINATSNDVDLSRITGKPPASIKSEASPVIAQIIDNIAMDRVAMTAIREREIQIQLHPVELGRLMVVVNSAEEQIKATIIASELVTSELLNREKEHLIAALKEQGIDLPDVNISHRDPRDASRDSSKDSESSLGFQRKRILTDGGSKAAESGLLGDVGFFDPANQISRINLIA